MSKFLVDKITDLCYNQNMKAELSQIKHARSVKEYPGVDLEPDEHVVLHITRAHIGIVLIWATVGFLILVVSIALIMISNSINSNTTFLSFNDTALSYLRIAIFAVYAIIVAGGFVAHSVYNSNEMYVTNHRAIQKSRTTLFANSTNIIKLSRIEDVSYRQYSLFDHIFQIGTLRMSTVGEETTYTFKYLSTPHDELKIISHLVYENKHGQPKPEE